MQAMCLQTTSDNISIFIVSGVGGQYCTRLTALHAQKMGEQRNCRLVLHEVYNNEVDVSVCHWVIWREITHMLKSMSVVLLNVPCELCDVIFCMCEQ